VRDTSGSGITLYYYYTDVPSYTDGDRQRRSAKIAETDVLNNIYTRHTSANIAA
jgi:hypothetical protein